MIGGNPRFQVSSGNRGSDAARVKRLLALDTWQPKIGCVDHAEHVARMGRLFGDAGPGAPPWQRHMPPMPPRRGPR
jgi:hypothetical protein